ncbi:hypothetical protein BGX29_010518 [Mortierella sp. GBA35]|nr:hypothetical protein BGX29_010518 [Mortierella sp. GBA35]
MSKCDKHIEFHEANEKRLMGLLHSVPADANASTTFININGCRLSVHDLRCQLYEARYFVYSYSDALKVQIASFRALELQYGLHNSVVLRLHNSDALRHRVKLVMDRLLAEDAVYNATVESTLANTYYVFRNRYLMYKYGVRFPEYRLGNFPHPGGVEPIPQGHVYL